MQPKPDTFRKAKLQPVTQCAERHRRCQMQRIAVSTTAYSRKSDVFKTVFTGQAQACQIGGAQQPILALVSAAPYGADRVDDKARVEPESGGNHRLPRREAADALGQGAADSKQFRPSSGMNGAIHTATAKQTRIGGIDDGVNAGLRQIPLDKFQTS